MGRTPGRPPVLADIVEEHFDELDFLWEHRESNIFTPDWTLDDLADVEGRAEAHLDGLRLAELYAIDLASEVIVGLEPYAAAAATFVLLEARDDACLERIREALEAGDREALDGVRTALRHHAGDEVPRLLLGLSEAREPFRSVIAADVLAFRREADGDPGMLQGDADPAVRALALAAAGRLGMIDEAAWRGSIEHPEPQVREAAWTAGARSGLHDVLPACRALAIRETDPDPVAIRFLGCLGGSEDGESLLRLTRRADVAEEAVDALGALGRVEYVPSLLELMASDVGVAATRAYRRITGATDVEGERTFPPPEVPEGEDEEEALPPDPDRAAADWDSRAGTMVPGRRWQGGMAIPEAGLPESFDLLPLESRADVYWAARARSGRAVPDLELEALERRQRGAFATTTAS